MFNRNIPENFRRMMDYVSFSDRTITDFFLLILEAFRISRSHVGQ